MPLKDEEWESKKKDIIDGELKLRSMRIKRHENTILPTIPEMPRFMKEQLLISEGKKYRCKACDQVKVYSDDELKDQRQKGIEGFDTSATPKQGVIPGLGSRDNTQA